MCAFPISVAQFLLGRSVYAVVLKNLITHHIYIYAKVARFILATGVMMMVNPLDSFIFPSDDEREEVIFRFSSFEKNEIIFRIPKIQKT
jgi:hypothetical protein